MPLFTVEEINFMSYFDTSSRHALIRDMEDTPLSAMDEEMSEMLFRMVIHVVIHQRQEIEAV